MYCISSLSVLRRRMLIHCHCQDNYINRYINFKINTQNKIKLNICNSSVNVYLSKAYEYAQRRIIAYIGWSFRNELCRIQRFYNKGLHGHMEKYTWMRLYGMNESSNRLFSPYYCGDKFECYNHVTSLCPGKCV